MGLVQDSLALEIEGGRQASVDRRWCHQAEAGVVVFVVVPAEELLAPLPGIQFRAEALRKTGMVFGGLELSF